MMDLNIEKALEALDRLWSETFCNNETSSMSNRSDRNLIKQALTPPTAEEVCKVLNNYIYPYDYMGDPKFKYNKITREFSCTNGWKIYLDIYNEVYINCRPLPPHIITLIGRFYENLNKEE